MCTLFCFFYLLAHLSRSAQSKLLWSLAIRRPFSFPCLHSGIYKYQPISTKLGPNVYDHKISDEFDYGTNRTRTVWVVCPWIRKFAIFDFVYALASANIDCSRICNYWPISTKLDHNVYAHKVLDEFDYGTYLTKISGVICPWIWKNWWIWLWLIFVDDRV